MPRVLHCLPNHSHNRVNEVFSLNDLQDDCTMSLKKFNDQGMNFNIKNVVKWVPFYN